MVSLLVASETVPLRVNLCWEKDENKNAKKKEKNKNPLWFM
ncbi:hypothetical protein FB2170_13548 [Maribacter sp. HTCC2170]|nr:hypothetical protein FB2170_13548 [Maribacter sp. HTCC2170]